MFNYQDTSIEAQRAVFQATILDNEYIPRDHMPFPKQLDALLDFRKELLFGGSAGGGKVIYTNTIIYTDMEKTTIEKLKVGDTVFDENGNQCIVLAKSDIEYNKPCYKLTFSDGSELIAGDTHLWPAVSIAEEYQLIRHTDEYRAKRRATRPSRGTGKRPDLAKRNSTQKYEYLPPITIRNKTTQELFETQRIGKRNRTNYYIPVCKPLKYTKKNLILDPYMLGVWLGDGHKGSSKITGIDKEIFDEIERRGFKVNHNNYKTHNVMGLITLIKRIGCYRDKHIPEEYLQGSVKQRVDLLRGIMDTDGYATKNGSCDLQLTRKELIDDISRLLHSLGIKHTVIEGNAKLYGRITSKKWRIKFNTNIKVFNLKRKSERQKRFGLRKTTFRRYIEKIEPVESVPIQCIKVSSPSGQYLVGESLIPTHNSDYLLMAALQFIKVPNYNSILFRRSYSDLALPDGLIPRSHEWLTSTDAKWKPDTHQWYFPKYNSSLTFGYLESENDIYRYKSMQVQMVGYEELTEFATERPYAYLFSRMRKLSKVNIPLRMRATTNPDGPGADWVYDRFLPDNPQPISVDRRFISSKLYDNPHIDQESYRANLAELDPITRMQLEDGAWKVKKAGNKFKMEWFKNRFVDQSEVPQTGHVVRYWDLAATEEKKRGSRTTDPDWTVGVRVRLAGNIYYIEDVVRKRVGPSGIEEMIKDTAEFDGHEVTIFIEQEPGATGKIVIEDFVRRVLSGYAAFGDRPTGTKEIRANIPSAALYNGNVRIVSAPWNKQFIDELILFPTKGVHDDQCFIAGTKIATTHGDKNIEDVAIGDILLTPGGYSTVTSCGVTGIRPVISNLGLTGTPDHKIFDHRKGFIPLETYDVMVDTLCVANQIRWNVLKQLYSMKYCTDSWAREDITSANQLLIREGSLLKACMSPFMSFIRNKQYQKAFSYIIKMGIHSIMSLAILNCYHINNILHYIPSKIKKNNWNISNQLENLLKSGMLRKKELNGIKNTLKHLWLNVGRKDIIESVSGVVKNLMQQIYVPNIVAANVQKRHIGLEEKQLVYNLTTEPSHTFYANGILVSNCDALSGAISKLPRVSQIKHGKYDSVESCGGVDGMNDIMVDDIKMGIEEIW